MRPPVRLAVLVSGGGTTLQNLLDRIAEGSLPAQVVAVSPRARSPAIEKAARAGVPGSP